MNRHDLERLEWETGHEFYRPIQDIIGYECRYCQAPLGHGFRYKRLCSEVYQPFKTIEQGLEDIRKSAIPLNPKVPLWEALELRRHQREDQEAEQKSLLD